MAGGIVGVIVLILLIIIFACSCFGGDGYRARFSNNLRNGSNNPLWWHGMGDAGHGGSMHSDYNYGASRVYGASADPAAGHYISPKAYPRQGCDPSLNPGAVAEAYALKAAGAYGGSAKNMSDDQLMKVMNGGSAM